MRIPKKIKILFDKKTVVTKAFFWKISHHSADDEVQLKIGRYNKNSDPFDASPDELECLNPKSELTLNGIEFNELIKFIKEEYEPFKQGVNSFISVHPEFNESVATQLRSIFKNPHQNLIDFICNEEIISADLSLAIENIRRTNAIREFEVMLSNELNESKWQNWFSVNPWVLGSEYIRILDERRLDTFNITDFLMHAFDGFVDIIEIKRPERDMKFWASSLDHGNLIPHSDLIKAISQTSRYIFEIEREQNSVKFQNSVNGMKVVKPRGVLIFWKI